MVYIYLYIFSARITLVLQNFRHSPRAPALVRNNLESHGVRFKKRNLEAVPSSHNTSKTRSDSNASTRRQLFDPEDSRFHSMQRIPPVDS